MSTLKLDAEGGQRLRLCKLAGGRRPAARHRSAIDRSLRLLAVGVQGWVE